MEDAERLFAWRNDPDSRANSRNEDDILWSDHLQWLSRVFASESVLLYVAEENGIPLGTCRVDADGELSWTVAPEHRGKGHGKEMVRLLAEAANRHLVAEIKSSNLASLRIVQELGFEKVADGEITRWTRNAPGSG
jgi:RimJ/RimL family protein N-acetyltransferase